MSANRSSPPCYDDYVEEAIGFATRWGRRLLVLLFVVSIAALGYYLFRGYLPEFHSDSAVKNLLAAEVLREHSYFPHDWNYVNGDLWVVFGQAFVIPLLPFLANGYKLHAISGLISSAIVLFSLWLVSGMVIRSFWVRFVVLTIFAGGVSTNMAENLFGQISYGNVLYLSVLTLYLGWRFLDARTLRSTVGWAVGFALLGILTFWGNPQRAAAYDAAPLLVAVAAWALASGDLLVWRPGARRWVPSPVAWKAFWLCLLLLSSAIIGTALHSLAIAHVNNIEGAGSAKWLGFGGIVSNLSNVVQGMLGIFGAILPPDQRVISPSGIYYAGRFVGICAMLVLMPIATIRLIKDARPAARMFGAFVGAGLALFVFLQVTTTTPDMSDPVSSGRYMLPFLVLGVVAIASFAEARGVRQLPGLAAWGALLVLLSSLISPLNSFSRMYRPYGSAVQQILAEDLKHAGLKYGYATYWNAGAVTVLANSEVAVRQVTFQGGLPMPFRHLASNYWFRPEAWKGQTFLALRPDELKQLDRDALFAYTGQPEKILTLGDFTVFVFPDNIAAKIPGWNKQRTSDPSTDLRISSDSKHMIGQLKKNGAQNWLESGQGEQGYLHFGPYVTLPEGKYRAEIDVTAEAKGAAGIVDIISEKGTHVFAAQAIEGAENEQQLVFDLDVGKEGAKELEVRVFSNGEGVMKLRRIELAPISH
jgi:hypothetical protein